MCKIVWYFLLQYYTSSLISGEEKHSIGEESMNNQKKDRVELLLNTIWSVGDRDECSIKHILHGLAMLRFGIDPSVEENYIDYSTAGFCYINSDYDQNIFVRSGFQKILWEEIRDIYEECGEPVLDDSSFKDGYGEFFNSYYDGTWVQR